MAQSKTVEDVRKRLAESADSDDLVAGVFDEIEQEWVRTGKFWVRLDSRLPWQLAECLRKHSHLLKGLRLRLDLSTVEVVDRHKRPMRKALWWGAPFRWDDLASYRGPVVTVHADPSDRVQQLNRVAQATFRWNFPRSERIGVLQIEEFRDAPGTPAASCSTKYLHSIVDLDRQVFLHLDGAIKTYSAEQYEQAYSDPSVKAGRYEKLFRTDDVLTIGGDAWMEVVATYFANDELVREYFGGA